MASPINSSDSFEVVKVMSICPSCVSDLDKLLPLTSHKHGHSQLLRTIFLWPFIKLMTAAVNHSHCSNGHAMQGEASMGTVASFVNRRPEIIQLVFIL